MQLPWQTEEPAHSSPGLSQADGQQVGGLELGNRTERERGGGRGGEGRVEEVTRAPKRKG